MCAIILNKTRFAFHLYFIFSFIPWLIDYIGFCYLEIVPEDTFSIWTKIWDNKRTTIISFYIFIGVCIHWTHWTSASWVFISQRTLCLYGQIIISQHWCQNQSCFAQMSYLCTHALQNLIGVCVFFFFVKQFCQDELFVHPWAVKSRQTALNFSLYSMPGNPGVPAWKASHSEKQIVKPQEGRCKAAGPWFVGHQSQSWEWMEVMWLQGTRGAGT